jgi:membrane fusion protein
MAEDFRQEQIFRRAALAARFQRQGSSVLITTPPSGWVTAAFSSVVAIVILGVAGFGEFTRTVTVTGTLVPERGIIRIFSPQQGVVTDKHFNFGELVHKGQPLYSLSSDRSDAAGKASAEQVSAAIRSRIGRLNATIAATQSLQEAEEVRLNEQRRDLDGQIAVSNQEMKVLTETIELDQRIESRKKGLQSSGYMPIDQLEAAQRQLSSDQTRHSSLKLDVLKLEQALADTQSQLRELPLNQINQISELERQLALADAELAENESRREIIIDSPEDGTISADLAETGQTVTTGTPMAVIAPQDAPLEAHLLVPSLGIGFVHAGERVSLRYQSYPYQKFGLYDGMVKTVSQIALDPSEMEALHAPLETREPIYRVTVTLSRQEVSAFDGELPLRAGMLVDADIGAETRRVWEWVFEPIYSLRTSTIVSSNAS